MASTRRGLTSSSGALLLTGTALWLFASGCASFPDSPAQNLAYERWRMCSVGAPTALLREIEPNGRIRFWVRGASDTGVVLDCLRRAGAAGPTLPEPIALFLPGGPG